MMTNLETAMFHPLANVFPLMSDEEFRALVVDIDANGLTDPIVMLEGKILDGRNRWKACQQLGIPHREIKFDELKLGSDDPAAFVWSRNTVRRHLTSGQRDMAAQKLEELGWGGNRSKLSTESLTREKIAEKTGATVTGMARAAKVRKRATPKVVKAVEDGDLSLRAADRIADLPKEEQEEVMESPKPAEEAARRVQTKKRVAPARKGPSPATVMRGHMTGHQSGVRDVQLIQKFWAEHADEIENMDTSDLRTFIKDLEESRHAAGQLLSLLSEKLIPEWTLPGRQPASLSTALNKIDAASKGEDDKS